MLAIALSSVWARKRRLAGTCVAIIIGVAFLSGTLVLGDTLSANFTRLFDNVSAGTDVIVRNNTSVEPGKINVQGRGLIPLTLLPAVQHTPGVAHAEAQIVGYGTLLGANGEPIGGNGPPRQAGSWISDRSLNPYRLVEGRAPRTTSEVVINRGAAKTGKLHIGDIATVQTPEPVRVTIVGIATFGDADGFGQATWTAFTLQGAQAHVTHRHDAASTISVRATPRTTSEQLQRRLAATLPPSVQAITGRQLAKERVDAVSAQFLGMLKTFLTVFAVIALLVAGITITNTFAITLTQRTQELGLLRAVGASRRQMRRSVTYEALVLGALSSAVGVAAGLGIAGLLKGLFDAAGGALPAGGLTIKPTAMLVGLTAGTVITVVAAQLPARRAARVAPVAALRDTGAVAEGSGRRRTLAGAVLVGLGAGTGALAATRGVLPVTGLASLILTAGVVISAPALVPVTARVVGSGLRTIRGANAQLAEDNARRNPRRTSATATALIIGVTVVCLFTVFAASMKGSLDQRVTRGFAADLALNTAAFGGSQLSPRVLDDLDKVADVDHAVAVGGGSVLLDHASTTATATNLDTISRVVTLQVKSGALGDVGDTGLAVGATRADDQHWRVGSEVTMTFADGTRHIATVRAIYADNQLTGPVLISDRLWSAHTAQPTQRTVYVTARDGVPVGRLQAEVEPIARRYGADVQDRAQFAAAATSGLDRLLGIVYVLLGLAIVIALLGIANALSLAVHERRHEIGLLRAVGQTRRQVRSALRLEAVIVSAFGTLAGLALGSSLGWLLFTAVSTSPGFTLPTSRLLTIAVIGALAGAVAARRPARRAARMPILDAISAP